MSNELLKKAADQIESLAGRCDALEAQLAAKTADNVKLAAAIDLQVKTASAQEDTKAALAGTARVVAASLFDAGVLKTAEAADKFAADVLDHTKALNVIGNLAGRIGTMPKTAHVVERTKTEAVQTADQNWESRIQAFAK